MSATIKRLSLWPLRFRWGVNRMALSEIELARVKKALEAFMQIRRPPLHIRAKLDLGYCISGDALRLASSYAPTAQHHRDRRTRQGAPSLARAPHRKEAAAGDRCPQCMIEGGTVLGPRELSGRDREAAGCFVLDRCGDV